MVCDYGDWKVKRSDHPHSVSYHFLMSLTLPMVDSFFMSGSLAPREACSIFNYKLALVCWLLTQPSQAQGCCCCVALVAIQEV